MSHRAFGMSFLAIAAMLFATRFICAALMAWDDFKYDPEGNYARALRAIPSELSTAAWISFAVGACYLIIMEMHSYIEWRRNYPKNGES